MIRTCPNCRAYYADAQLAFCLVDGTPLVNVDPSSEQWSEGSRFIQEKVKVVRKLRRRRWLRRIVLAGLTTVLLASVMTKSFTMETTAPPLKSQSSPPPPPPEGLFLPEEPAASDAASPSPTDFPSPSPTLSTSPSPSRSDVSSPSPTPTPSPSPSPSPSPTSTPPVVFYKISGRVTSASGPISGVKMRLEGQKLTSTTTDANGYYTFSRLIAGGSYTVIPVGQTSFSPANRSINDLRRDESADFFGLVKSKEEEKPTPTPAPECSDSDKERIAADLIARNKAQWRRDIEQERPRIIASTFDVKNATATLGPIDFQPTLTKCSTVVVIARYAWQVTADLQQGVKTVTVPKAKRFMCGKRWGTWFCVSQ